MYHVPHPNTGRVQITLSKKPRRKNLNRHKKFKEFLIPLSNELTLTGIKVVTMATKLDKLMMNIKLLNQILSDFFEI